MKRLGEGGIANKARKRIGPHAMMSGEKDERTTRVSFFQSIRVTRGRLAGLALRPRPLDVAAGRAADLAAISLWMRRRDQLVNHRPKQDKEIVSPRKGARIREGHALLRRLNERKVAREDFFEERFLRRFGDGAERFLLGLILDQCVALQTERGECQFRCPTATGNGAPAWWRRTSLPRASMCPNRHRRASRSRADIAG
jgi:hypothetical protein